MAERDLTAIEAEILGWALDGDSIALYAVGWPPEAIRPSDPADRRLADAQEAAIRLVGDGLLEVVRAEPIPSGESLHRVAPEMWEDILSDPRNWGTGDPEFDARQRETHFEVGATEAGTQMWLAYAKAHGLIGFTKFDRLARRVRKRPANADFASPS
jgi:hypothetical protein